MPQRNALIIKKKHNKKNFLNNFEDVFKFNKNTILTLKLNSKQVIMKKCIR